MLEKENTNNFQAPVEVMKDGIRFRRKRKHKDIDKMLVDEPMEIQEQEVHNSKENQNQKIFSEDETGHSKGKKFKYSKNKENKNSQNEKIIQQSNINKQNEIILNTNNNIQNLVPSNLQVQNNISTKVIYDDKEKENKTSNKMTLEEILKKEVNDKENGFNAIKQQSSNISENRKVYLLELERIKTVVKNFQDHFLNISFPLMKKKLVACCKKNTRSVRDFKVATLFKSDSPFHVKISNYSLKTHLINLELLFIDSILDSKNTLESLLEVDYPNIGNILLCYFSESCMLKIITSILPIIEGHIEKLQSDVVVIKIRDLSNLINRDTLVANKIMYSFFKEGYLKLAKLEKNIKKGKQISDEFDNIIFSDLINLYNQNIDLKNLHYFDFEEYKDLFFNHPMYIDTQIKNSEIYNKIIKYAHEEALENNLKKIKMMKIKGELTSNYNDIFSKYCNMDIFYLNTADLISEFLEN